MTDLFNKNSSLLEITEKYPETIPVFTSNGFGNMDNREQREKLGGSVTLGMSLMLKQIDYDSFEKFLIEAIEAKNDKTDLTLAGDDRGELQEDLNVVGLLPCPVRIPMLESFNSFIESYKKESDVRIKHELKAASMGLDWVENNIRGVEDASELPDLFISAGFDMFFDEKMIGRFKKQNAFKDTTGLETLNSSFDKIDLKDPAGHYSMISVVPAVFLINMKELGDRPLPESWKDILDPAFENRVSLPVGDFDLFNAILLNIHKIYGDDGIAALGRNLLESLHPSQMVKSDRKKENRPIVTIMPYFFTKMVKEGGSMKAVWPKDGSIISPIFMLAKREKLDILQPVIDFFASEEVGSVLAHSGMFPSTNPNIDNRLKPEDGFMWLGWDYIYNNDIGALISHCEAVFDSALVRGA
ncbi:MAG: ABC transporter substrate-binding protein [Spirochaetales bacterium]|uniref:ABC transporter substrate-binding protein n=1 Tax=Candidatus Thalassospirochaeta sargassi TaxID=3119039 RepID=A0AAJ1IAE1_9SPIO|nr:ABC transporter substrate-binding protein [Spirochaetales bacterium]